MGTLEKMLSEDSIGSALDPLTEMILLCGSSGLVAAVETASSLEKGEVLANWLIKYLELRSGKLGVGRTETVLRRVLSCKPVLSELLSELLAINSLGRPSNVLRVSENEEDEGLIDSDVLKEEENLEDGNAVLKTTGTADESNVAEGDEDEVSVRDEPVADTDAESKLNVGMTEAETNNVSELGLTVD